MRVAVFIATALVMQAAHTVKWGFFTTFREFGLEIKTAQKAMDEGSTLLPAICRAIFAKGDAAALENFDKEMERQIYEEKIESTLKETTSKVREVQKISKDTEKIITDQPPETQRNNLRIHPNDLDPLSLRVQTFEKESNTKLEKMMRRILGGKDLLAKETTEKEVPDKDNKEEIKPDEQKSILKVKEGDAFSWKIECDLPTKKVSNVSLNNICRGKEFNFYYLSSKGGHVKAYERSLSLNVEANKQFFMLYPFEKIVTPIMTSEDPCSFTFTSAPVLAALAGVVYALLF